MTLRIDLSVFLILGLLWLGACADPAAKIAREADELMEERKFAEATEVLRKALLEDQGNRHLLESQIRLFLYTDQPVYALAAYRTLKEDYPDSEALALCVEDPETVVRVNAAKALGMLRDEKSVRALSDAADDPNQQVRQAVVLALGDLKSPDGLPALIRALEDEDWFVRAEAVTAIGKIGNVHTVPMLFPLLQDEDSYVRDNTRKALIELATPANESAYLDALHAPDAATRRMGAIALAHIGNPAGLEILIKELESPQMTDSIRIVEAMILLNHPEALPALRKAARHENIEVALPAVLALGRMQDKESASYVRTLSNDGSRDIRLRRAALVSLQRIQNAP